MSEDQKVAVVTGSNRGIGLQIVKDLTKLGMNVILTSRSEDKGKEAIEELKSEDINVVLMNLDVSSRESIERFATELESKFGRCDVLVNNAGIFPDTDGASSSWPSVLETDIEVVKKAMQTNVYGPMLLCQEIVPLMRKNGYGRIVNLSSGMGQLTNMNGGCPAYRISKTSINALTRILAEEQKDLNIKVNSMCPGWVKTKMGGSGATRELAEGADTAVFLATLPDDGPTGGFFRDRKPFDW